MSEPGGRRRGKAPRAPIRHGGRRRREREEKVSRAAAFPGAGLFCLRSPPVSPPPPTSQPRAPGSPAVHVAILARGVGVAGPALGGAGVSAPDARPAPSQPSLPRAPIRPSRPGPSTPLSLPRLPAAPVLRGRRDQPAPGGPCARCQLLGVEADPGLPPPSRLAEPRPPPPPPPPLYARELLRGPEDANFLVCTCGSRCDLGKLAASGVTGIWGNGVILNNLQFLQTCALHRLTGEAGRCV